MSSEINKWDQSYRLVAVTDANFIKQGYPMRFSSSVDEGPIEKIAVKCYIYIWLDVFHMFKELSQERHLEQTYLKFVLSFEILQPQ